MLHYGLPRSHPPSFPPSLSHLHSFNHLTTLRLPPDVIRDDTVTEMHFFAAGFGIGRRGRTTWDTFVDNGKPLFPAGKFGRACEEEGGLEEREGGGEGGRGEGVGLKRYIRRCTFVCVIIILYHVVVRPFPVPAPPFLTFPSRVCLAILSAAAASI